MIFKLDQQTGAITEVTADEARRSLRGFGWSTWSINDFFFSAKVLYTHFAYFSRFKDRLEELIEAQSR